MSNERCKVRAEAMNNLAILFVGSFLVSPFIEKGQTSVVIQSATYVWIILALALHMGAHYLLGLIEPDD